MANPWVKPNGDFYCGYNPEFVARVHAKRREARRREDAERLRRMKEENERKRREAERQRKENAMRRAREQIQREREEIEATRKRFEKDIQSEKAEIEAQRDRFENMARRAADTIRAKEKGLRPVSEIILAKAIEHGITPGDIMGKSRQQKIVNARHEAMAEAYVERPDLSLIQIGRHFKRDHTSVLHAVKVRGVWRNPGRTYESKDAA